jgi:hypothetical protein
VLRHAEADIAAHQVHATVRQVGQHQLLEEVIDLSLVEGAVPGVVEGLQRPRIAGQDAEQGRIGRASLLGQRKVLARLGGYLGIPDGANAYDHALPLHSRPLAGRGLQVHRTRHRLPPAAWARPISLSSHSWDREHPI